jgi:hypothetical protein
MNLNQFFGSLVDEEDLGFSEERAFNLGVAIKDWLTASVWLRAGSDRHQRSGV